MKDKDCCGNCNDEEVKNLEGRILKIVSDLKIMPSTQQDSKLLGELGKLSLEYKELTGSYFTVKRRATNGQYE